MNDLGDLVNDYKNKEVIDAVKEYTSKKPVIYKEIKE